MPKTCTETDASHVSIHTDKHAVRTVPSTRFVPRQKTDMVVCDVMEQFFKGLQVPLMAELVTTSLKEIQEEFYDGSPDATDDLHVLQRIMDAGPLYTRLTIFLFLFNVHVGLKNRIMRIDPSNARKLVRFMADMRNHIVMAFCVDERQHTRDFVQAAHECYILA